MASVKIEAFVVMGRGFSGSCQTYAEAKNIVDLHGEGKVYVETSALLDLLAAACCARQLIDSDSEIADFANRENSSYVGLVAAIKKTKTHLGIKD